MPTRFLYFDLGNVLLGFSHERAARQMADLAGCAYALVWDVVFGSQRLEFAYEEGEITSQQFHTLFCQRTNTQPPYKELLLAGSAIFTPFQESFEIVSQLKSRGQRLGVLSNTCDAHWQYCLTHYPAIQNDFSIHCLSFRVGSMKPAQAIYQVAMEMADSPAAEIFFVDDRPENVDAAKQYGFDAVLFHSPEQLRRDLVERKLL